MLTLKEKNENKNKKSTKEKWRKKYTPKYKELWKGVKKCLVCGFAVAEKEERTHLVYHDSFLKFKKAVMEENYSDLILTYDKFIEFHKSIEKDRGKILSGGCDLDYIKAVVTKIIWHEFNEYHSFRGYNSNKNINYNAFATKLLEKDHFIEELQILFNKDFNGKLLKELKNKYKN